MLTKWIEPSAENYSERLVRLHPNLFPTINNILTLTFQVTEACSCRCTYCYQHNKSNARMNFSMAKTIIDNLLTNDSCYNTSGVNGIVLEFIGGEPLLEIDLISQISDYFMAECIRLNHRFLNHFCLSISSNGLAYFEPKVQAFIKKHKSHLSLGISIDGCKELHDACRFDLKGNGTYDRAIAAAMDLKRIQGGNIETKMTLSPDNIQYTFKALQNLIDLGYQIIHFNCVYEEGWALQHATILYYQLKQIADWLFENDSFQKYHISMFNKTLFSPMSPDENENYCGGTCNGMLSFDYRGNAFPCIRYMNSSLNGKQTPYSIGTIDGLFRTPIEQERRDLLVSITRRSQSTDECFNCSIASGCGYCSGYNYECFGTPNKRATFICQMHKARALANAYYYNKGFRLSGETERLKIHLPKEEALKIIPDDEWKLLEELADD